MHTRLIAVVHDPIQIAKKRSEVVIVIVMCLVISVFAAGILVVQHPVIMGNFKVLFLLLE